MLGTLDEAEIEAILNEEVVAHIGCHDAGRPYVVPITFAYDGKAIYCHSVEGLKLHMMRANPYVCVEVERVDDLANWRSVVAWGTFEELTGVDAEHALHLLVERLVPRMPSSPGGPDSGGHGHAHDTAGHSPVLYRIVLSEKTGRFEQR